jgi:hypothetical protein
MRKNLLVTLGAGLALLVALLLWFSGEFARPIIGPDTEPGASADATTTDSSGRAPVPTTREGLEAAPSDPLSVRVVGRVVDGAGSPVADAVVAASWSRAELSGRVGRSSRSSADGRFEIELAALPEALASTPSRTFLLLHATADGFLEAEVRTKHTPWLDGTAPVCDCGDVVLTARPAASVVGRIVDPEGSPVAHANVRCAGRRERTRTNEDGTFDLRFERPEVLSVSAHRWDVGDASFDVDLTSTAHTDVGDIVLRAADFIEGRLVLGDGTSANGVPIRLAADPDAGDYGIEFDTDVSSITTDADGAFRFAVAIGERRSPYLLVLEIGGGRQVFETARLADGPVMVDGQHVTLVTRDHGDRVLPVGELDFRVWSPENAPSIDALRAVENGIEQMAEWPEGASGMGLPSFDGETVGLLSFGGVLCVSAGASGFHRQTIVHRAETGVFREHVEIGLRPADRGGRVRFRITEPGGRSPASYEVDVKNRWGARVLRYQAPGDLDPEGGSPLLPAEPLFFEIDPDPDTAMIYPGDPLLARCIVREGEVVDIEVTGPAVGVLRVGIELADPSVPDAILAALRITATTGDASVEMSPGYRISKYGTMSAGRVESQIRKGGAFGRAVLPVGAVLVEVALPGFAIQRRSVEVRAFEETIVTFRIGE